MVTAFITQALKAISVSASTSLKAAWLLKPDLDLKSQARKWVKRTSSVHVLFIFIHLPQLFPYKEHTTMIAYLTPTIRSVYNIYRHEWCSAGQILILLRRGCIGRSSLVTLKINTDTIMFANSLWESRCDLFVYFLTGLSFIWPMWCSFNVAWTIQTRHSACYVFPPERRLTCLFKWHWPC